MTRKADDGVISVRFIAYDTKNGMSEQTKINWEDIVVRDYCSEDQPCIARLYTDGLLAGQIAPNDTGADVDNIWAAYFDCDQHRFWVAEVDGEVVGMIGVGSDDPHTAEIRRLRVDPKYQDSPIAAKLLKIAINHCKYHQFLKVRLDTRFERADAVELFDELGFQHTRTRSVHDKETLEFYLDLYRQEDKQE